MEWRSAGGARQGEEERTAKKKNVLYGRGQRKEIIGLKTRRRRRKQGEKRKGGNIIGSGGRQMEVDHQRNSEEPKGTLGSEHSLEKTGCKGGWTAKKATASEDQGP